MSDHFLSHSNIFGFEMGKDAAGCRAFNRNFIVGGENIMNIRAALYCRVDWRISVENENKEEYLR